jgi:chemotaxis protein methyltransferase CheR
MEKVIRFLQERFGMNVSQFDTSFLERTIAIQVGLSMCKSTDEYLKKLTKSPAEVVLLSQSLTNSYSEFFRNPLTFALLKQIIFPKVFNSNGFGPAREVRIWSAGCAAGQEPYSLAMLANDFVQEHQLTTSFRIFATDISDKQLAEAKRGMYDLKAIRNTSHGFVSNYFTQKGASFIIHEKLKSFVEFSKYDLLDARTNAPPSSIFGGFDIIMCSNVLFYYQAVVQTVILDKLSRSLNRGGFLLTGEAEIAIVKGDNNFKQFFSPSTVFTKT